MNYFNKKRDTIKDEKVSYYKAIDWNTVEDPLTKMTWEKLTSQFWLDTRIPVSNDLKDWRKLSKVEQDVFNKAFVGLTMLDTLQSEEGAMVLMEDSRTQHEEAVLKYIVFNEAVHAKSYSTIFQSLNETRKIDEIFEWGNNNQYLQKKAEIINKVYQEGTSLQKKVASVFLESFLFYSGFYVALWYLGNAKMVNTAEIIRLIIRDESVHGTFIGYLFQKEYNEITKEEQSEIRDWMYGLLYELYINELAYTEEVYSEIGWVEDVTTFLEYNANKALQNLGFDGFFSRGVAENVNTLVLNGLSTESSNHDFFSQVGNSYLVGKVEEMKDEDYDF